MTMEENDELAEGMKRKLDKFELSVDNLEATLKPFLNISANDIADKISDPLVKARLDLMIAYSINSLFWAYLTTQGVNPKQHPIRNELKRVQEYMGKVKLMEEKKKMARIDTHAAKRFVRNALWQAPPSASSATDGASSGAPNAAPDGISRDNVGEDTEDGEFEAPAPKRLKRDDNTAETSGSTSSETKKKSKKKKSKKDKKEKKKKKKDDSD